MKTSHKNATEKTLAAALTVLGGCAAARWHLDRSSRRETELCWGRARLTAAWNTGAAFDLPLPARCLPALSAGVLALAWFWRRPSPLGVGLLLGGGASNLLERVRHGRVYDYLQFPSAPGKLRRCVFNAADLAILLGAGMLAAASETEGNGARQRQP